MNPYRKLLIAGTNELLDRELISLTPENSERNESGNISADLYGHPSIIIWEDIGHKELRISVWWKYDNERHPQIDLEGSSGEHFTCTKPLTKPARYREFVGVTVSGWLERKNGHHLQGEGRRGMFDIYTRSGEKHALEKLMSAEPKGYKAEGRFYF